MTSQDADTDTELSNTQAERNERSRRTLLATARRIIAAEGCRAVTSARIQQASGLSRGLVSYYFGSKEGLILALIDKTRETFTEVYNPIRENSDGLTGILSIFDLYIRRLQQDSSPAVVMILIAADSARDDESQVGIKIKSAFAYFRQLFVDLIEIGKIDGSVGKQINSEPVSALLESIIRGLVLQYLIDPTQINLEAIRVETDTALRRILKP